MFLSEEQLREAETAFNRLLGESGLVSWEWSYVREVLTRMVRATGKSLSGEHVPLGKKFHSPSVSGGRSRKLAAIASSWSAEYDPAVPVMPEHPQSPALDPILSRRAEFRAFLVSRLGSEADADDVLQTGFMKALRSASDVRDEQKLTAWFYQLLRNAIVDHVRSRRAREVRDDTWAIDQATPGDAEIETIACRCIEPLIDELKPREAELVRRIEFGSEPVAEAARASGITSNNASVMLHRARKKLRERLEAFCGECASSACLDCDCGDKKLGR